MAIEEQLTNIFASRPSGPFLFLGSGFSRRYLGLEGWRGLLEKFCVCGKPFEYYLAAANGELPAVARLLSVDFNDHWWSSPDFRLSVERHKSKILNVSSALRIEICAYLSTLDQTKAKHSVYAEEVELLSALNVDGIITTNWDLFIEQLFPDYKVYIGQKELLFSNPQGIAEIYKIHGCSTRPDSLVLTDDDYREFNQRNAYLAAKLITLFVEHAIVFVGYSISDPNVSGLLRDIASCIGDSQLEQLRQNLVFVQRSKPQEQESVTDTFIAIDGVQIPLVLVKSATFNPVYRAINSAKRKIPARVLRICKEQLYELVKSSEPEKKLRVLDIDDIDKTEGVEFVVGIGVAAPEVSAISEVGYTRIQLIDLIQDALHEDRDFDPNMILSNVVQVAGRYTKNIPVFKYLSAVGVTTEADYRASGWTLDKWVMRDVKEFRVKTYATAFFRKHRHQSVAQIIAACTPENAAAYIPFLARDKIDLDELRSFLVTNEGKMCNDTSNYASNFRKLAAFYDRLKWGW